MSYVQLSEGGFQVVCPLSLWSRFSGVVKVRFGYGYEIIYIHIYIYTVVLHGEGCKGQAQPRKATA